MNAHQRRLHLRRYIKPWMGELQRQMALGLALGERRSRWQYRNPLGSKNNPFIVSYEYWKLLVNESIVEISR